MNPELKKIAIAIVISVAAFLLSLNFFNTVQSALIGSVTLLVTLWTNEALPLGVVSLLPIILFPSFEILDTAKTAANYSKSIIFLFLGGFMVAIAVEKINLHKFIASKIMKIFPKSPRGLITALAITSATLSSLLSNTTTALLLMPIALFLTDIKELKIRFVLAVAYGASIGGIITPIGTPPNLILMGFLEENSLESLAFFQWILKTLPLAAIMLAIVSWVLAIGTKEYVIDNECLECENLNKKQKRLKNILLALIALLFINSPIKPFYDGLGLSDAGILLSFGLIMFMPRIGFLKWKDTKKMPYEIIFLFGAGFSIASAFGSTNLANEIANMLLALTQLQPFILLLIVAAMITFTTEITSNTALISIALPIIYSLGTNANIDINQILMVATICASYAFMLPIATPPNAIAMSSRDVAIKDMAKFGIVFNLVAIVLTSSIAMLLW